MTHETEPSPLRQELGRVAAMIQRLVERGRRDNWVTEPGSATDPTPDPGPSRHPALLQMCERLELTPTEADVLGALVAFDLDPRLRQVLGQLGGAANAVILGTLLALVYPERPDRGLGELAVTGRLRREHLIVEDPADADAPFSRRRVRAAERVLAYLAGNPDKIALDPALDGLAVIDDTPAHVVGSLILDERVRDQVRAAFERGHDGLLVLCGASGSGRRTLLAGAVRAFGRRALTVDARALAADLEAARKQLRIVGREARLLDLVPLIRHAEVLAGAADGGRRMALLETELRGLVLVTTTSPLARPWARPPLVIEVPPLTGPQCEAMWQRALPPAGDGDAEVLATTYPLAPSMIAAAGAAALQACGTDPMTPAHVEAGIRGVLDHRLAGLATRLTVTQSWDDLILPDDQATALVELLARIRERRRVFEDWGFAAKVGRGVGTAALFSGPPGTGKTMAAGLIARELGVEIYQVDTSKIVSKWIGETEQHLAALFDAAEAGHAVLLFDEADSLFGKRTEVRTSTDRHANQETNYLLQRIERFAGICVLTTNHVSAIDEAFRRRLAVHVRFPLPEETERARLWRALVPAAAPTDGELPFAELARSFALTGGYIRNAVLRAAFLAADEDRPINGDHLTRAARLELEAMGRIAFGP